MTSHIHQDLADTLWFKLSLSDQLANIGSEFSRAYQAKKNHKEKRFEPAFLRMLELLNLTLNDPRWKGYRKQEIARLKENILENLNLQTTNLSAIANLEKYFYYFGISRKS
ncbi:hypothetical protein ACFLZV_00505 [Candidatus Margulisiibacteriota bacterium]